MNNRIINKLKNNPFITVVIICASIIPIPFIITVHFYEMQIGAIKEQVESVKSKCEADKANMRSYYEKETKKSESETSESNSENILKGSKKLKSLSDEFPESISKSILEPTWVMHGNVLRVMSGQISLVPIFHPKDNPVLKIVIEGQEKSLENIEVGKRFEFIYKQKIYFLDILELSRKAYKIKIAITERQ